MSVNRKDLFKLAGVGPLYPHYLQSLLLPLPKRWVKWEPFFLHPKETGWWCVVEDGQV